ncbi:predicted protein [Botrytis cinerea T4]|uniref:Uncharacterized protein n=1 Tax=Botryotinia fuckeliana (strain T4) TaxID=999810 RepID=G2YEN5_BOTF4|nr:predicted protein [Botrytis cinerea T4]
MFSVYATVSDKMDEMRCDLVPPIILCKLHDRCSKIVSEISTPFRYVFPTPLLLV